jgi:hypothetical protein
VSDSAAAELSLGALRAVDRELVVDGEVGTEALVLAGLTAALDAAERGRPARATAWPRKARWVTEEAEGCFPYCHCRRFLVGS